MRDVNHFSISVKMPTCDEQWAMWSDNMIKQKLRLRLSVLLMTILAYSISSVSAMSYEEPKYSIVKKLKFMRFVNTKSEQLQRLHTLRKAKDLRYYLIIYHGQIKVLKKLR